MFKLTACPVVAGLCGLLFSNKGYFLKKGLKSLINCCELYFLGFFGWYYLKLVRQKGTSMEVVFAERFCSCRELMFPGLFFGFIKKGRFNKVKFLSQKPKQSYNGLYSVNSAVFKIYL